MQNSDREFIPPTTIYDFYSEWRGFGTGIGDDLLVALRALLQRMRGAPVRLASAAQPGAPARSFAMTDFEPDCTGCSAELQECYPPVSTFTVKKQRHMIGFNGFKEAGLNKVCGLI